MTTASAFSSSGEDVIQRTIDINLDDIADIIIPETPEDFLLFEEIYDVRWTADEIIAGKYNQIALQFPDELLCVSVPIFQCLKKRLPLETGLYVLADTSYGRPSRLPVLFVFPKAQIDVKSTVNSLLDTLLQQDVPSHVILIPNVSYAHVSDTLYNELQSSHRLPPNVTVIYNLIPRRASPVRQNDTLSVPNGSTTQSQLPSHRQYTLPDNVPLSSCIILYVGKESLGLTNLLMTHPNNTIISYNPSCRTESSNSAKIESVRSNKLLMRRYAIVQKARDADIFGILVGTLGVASYLPLISHLCDLIRRRKKKFYTLTVGKLNPAKLANFADIECFVMVACPENSVVESKEFYRPIITPFELYLALNGEPIWPGNYILDFEQVMRLQKEVATHSEQNTVDDPDRPMFSLATGKYRYVKKYETDHFKESESTAGQVGFSSSSSSDLILRNTDTALTNLASNVGADFLRQKTFKGLETRLGQDAPSVLKQGRSGIAKDYNEQL
ncbi:hypothetical protein Clacol_009456 [Clathrus columnatus]|uniref:2-(3-amino-3-carboxypropyl)histidine synthase subunit 2 n=1 Tax=Clathrus columnatus TaxID=1419009 RepID=A0AAV5AL79_9AGAM|nr:hypothetical protein Clacol_009456 [Clathrus columnatus]